MQVCGEQTLSIHGKLPGDSCKVIHVKSLDVAKLMIMQRNDLEILCISTPLIGLCKMVAMANM